MRASYDDMFGDLGPRLPARQHKKVMTASALYHGKAEAVLNPKQNNKTRIRTKK